VDSGMDGQFRWSRNEYPLFLWRVVADHELNESMIAISIICGIAPLR